MVIEKLCVLIKGENPVGMGDGVKIETRMNLLLLRIRIADTPITRLYDVWAPVGISVVNEFLVHGDVDIVIGLDDADVLTDGDIEAGVHRLAVTTVLLMDGFEALVGFYEGVDDAW